MDQHNQAQSCSEGCTHQHSDLPFQGRALAELSKKRDFWDSQPVLKLNEIGNNPGPIE